jgi:2'-hydroxyisoflavone reductase
MIDRRGFVIGSLASAAVLGCSRKDEAAGTSSGPSGPSGSSPPQQAKAQPDAAPAPAPVKKATAKKILILGGTNFIGPHIVEAARARGHKITLFNRGKTHADLFPDVEKLQGDRDGKLDALKGKKWDAVVDTSGFVPRIVKMSAELLASAVELYVFISSISVYDDKGQKPGADETSKLAVADDPKSEDRKYYGANKARSEEAAAAAMPGRVTAIRPGLIVGPRDPTGRFTHWPARMSEGGEVLAPGDGSTPTQIIDGRDLADWIVKVIEDKTFGTFNALGPEQPMTMRDMLDSINGASGDKARLVWVADDFLDKHKVEGWSEMPAWISLKDMPSFGTLSNKRAVDAGLRFRPVHDTAVDTLAWLAKLPPEERAKVRSSGIKPDKEAAVLAAWKKRT